MMRISYERIVSEDCDELVAWRCVCETRVKRGTDCTVSGVLRGLLRGAWVETYRWVRSRLTRWRDVIHGPQGFWNNRPRRVGGRVTRARGTASG